MSGLTAEAAPSIPRCLACHPAHYRDRGGCVDCHRGNPGTERIAIAHDRLIAARFSYFTLGDSPVVAQGNTLAGTAGCRRCHTIGGKGTTLASDLDRLAGNARPEDLAASIQHPVAQMPDFHFGDADTAALVNLLLCESRDRLKARAEEPLIVHFENKQDTENIFVKACGGCHRALSAREGGLGEKDSGPNLSALLTPYYPLGKELPAKDRAWTPEDLEKWLKNPRKQRPQTRMPPVSIKEQDLTRLKEILSVPPSLLNPPVGSQNSP